MQRGSPKTPELGERGPACQPLLHAVDICVFGNRSDFILTEKPACFKHGSCGEHRASPPRHAPPWILGVARPAEPQEAEVMEQDSLRLSAALLQEEHGSGSQVCRTAPNILRFTTGASWEHTQTMAQASSDWHAQAWWIHPLDADNL